MAVKITKRYVCDICGKEFKEENYWNGKDQKPSIVLINRYSGFPIVFMTEQNEGKACPPYVDFKELDICNDCVLSGIKIRAKGVQGYNEYWIED